MKEMHEIINSECYDQISLFEKTTNTNVKIVHDKVVKTNSDIRV